MPRPKKPDKANPMAVSGLILLKRVTPLMNRVAKTPATTAPRKIVGALFVCVIRKATQIPGNTA